VACLHLQLQQSRHEYITLRKPGNQFISPRNTRGSRFLRCNFLLLALYSLLMRRMLCALVNLLKIFGVLLLVKICLCRPTVLLLDVGHNNIILSTVFLSICPPYTISNEMECHVHTTSNVSPHYEV
jgi:hypothetical protein